MKLTAYYRYRNIQASIIVALFTALFAIPVIAMWATYAGGRKWIEQKAVSHQQCKDGLIYIGRQFDGIEYGLILCYHTNLTLREIIDKSPEKGSNVFIALYKTNFDDYLVARPPYTIKVKTGDNPNCKIDPGDMLWMYPDTSMPKW